MKRAVLLAAGTGSRLMPLTKEVPKCMVQVNGRPIVDTLLDALEELGIESIIVVTGYKAEALESHLRQYEQFEWTFIHNERYATTNNILSLQVANEAIEAPFILVESDIYVEKDLLGPLEREDQIMVAAYQPTMDGTGITMNEQGQATEMVIRAHLHRPDDLPSMFKTVNFYSFSEETWEVYRRALDEWVEAERLDQYYEAVLAELINEGRVHMEGAVVGLEGWAEVDDANDLSVLEARLAGK